jgi:hypothetical protein
MLRPARHGINVNSISFTAQRKSWDGTATPRGQGSTRCTFTDTTPCAVLGGYYPR